MNKSTHSMQTNVKFYKSNYYAVDGAPHKLISYIEPVEWNVCENEKCHIEHM